MQRKSARRTTRALAARLRGEPREVALVGVGGEDVGTGLGVADHRDRGRVDLDPLEEVEVHAEGVGEHGLDDVAVADRHPDRIGAVRGRDRGVATAYGVDRARLHLRQRLTAGERRRRRVGLHGLPQRRAWPARATGGPATRRSRTR